MENLKSSYSRWILVSLDPTKKPKTSLIRVKTNKCRNKLFLLFKASYFINLLTNSIFLIAKFLLIKILTTSNHAMKFQSFLEQIPGGY